MEPELILLLIIIFGPAIAQWLGLGKKKGPTGKTLPPVQRRPRAPPPTRPSRSAPSGRAERDAAASTRTTTPEQPWWEAEPEEATPASTSARRESAEVPWWETPESATRDRPRPDPWRDDPDRPQGPVVRTPEDLWEILTGQKSPFPVPEPPVEPEPEPVAFPADDRRAPRPEPMGDTDVISLEGESLEATEISSEARHAEFHRLIDRPRPAIRRRSALERLGLERRTDVRRAIVLAEVLGKPRSLSPPDW